MGEEGQDQDGRKRIETQVKEPEKTGTEVRELTDVDRDFFLLNEKISKLEELYRKGEVEEEAYKRLKEENFIQIFNKMEELIFS